MTLFDAVKAGVTAREAAERYGLKVEKRGSRYFTRCIFHQEKTASMLIDRAFYCFGCGGKGSVIDLVARLFDLQPKEAAEKLAQDFGIPYTGHMTQEDRKALEEARVRRDQAVQVKRAEETFFRNLADYAHLLRIWKAENAPKRPEDPWDECFVEAVRELPFVEYLLDQFLEADEDEKKELLRTYGGQTLDKGTRQNGSGPHEGGGPARAAG